MVSASFKRKKIDSLTLGEKMKKIRSERRLSLNEISKYTRIQVKYLEFLENGQYQKLPADVYVVGFLRSYAEFVGVNDKVLVKLFEREKRIQKNINKIDDDSKKIEPLKLSKSVITPKIIAGTAVAVFIFLSLFYLYREIDTFISNPRLVIIEPLEGQIVKGKTVLVRGFTEKEAELYLNDQPVLISDSGDFAQELELQRGLNVVKLNSKSKFNKETTKTVTIQADYQEEVDGDFSDVEFSGTPENKKLEMEIAIKSSPTWILVEADGNVIFSGTIPTDETRKFEAREKIRLTSSKGSNTYIKINGKDLGILDQDPGIIKEREFQLSQFSS
jgi:transcriptional regulator with XRE-family HTH domain